MHKLPFSPAVAGAAQRLSSGSSTPLISVNDKPGGQTITFAQYGLSSVTWLNQGGQDLTDVNQFDTLGVTCNEAVTAAVPQPVRWALPGGGAALGTLLRRRSRS